ncbi:hypothetical protein DL546_001653 [Coniochaeta pulveracea]|uniref:5-formyltetrahydrofolate cyclo-ligase n=1 Tax=Coniochaeta pulveracea TaxID=177199 RepID=A0A420YE69_9PEZI|nr:hypothetical protein DL546_001653 [Coniochaeta pulveracea]
MHMVTDEFAMNSLNAAKQQLRSAMKQRLGAISKESVKAQSSVVFNKLREFKPYVEARRVSIFLSMSTGEIQTDGIVRHALESGKEVFVPYLHRNPLPSPDLPVRVMDMVRLRDIEDYESLQPDRWGIPSIDPATVHDRQRIFGGPDAHHSDKALLDLILVPGVAFDIAPETGAIRRLGHGKGFYDYFINRLKAKAKDLGVEGHIVNLYALGLSEQLLRSPAEGSIPMGPYDQRIDGLILGDGQVVIHPTD